MKKYVILIILLLTIFTLCGCNQEKNDPTELKEKVEEELSYLDNSLIFVINKLNNISFDNYSISSEEIELINSAKTPIQDAGKGSSSGAGNSGTEENSEGSSEASSGENSGNGNKENTKVKITQMNPNSIIINRNNEIDWTAIKPEIEKINYIWNNIILDLYNLNVDGTEIINFSKELDNTIIAVKDENKKETLNSLTNLYNQIPKYFKMISSDNSKQNIEQTKANIINAYRNVENDNWTGVNADLGEGIKSFKNVINDIDYSKKREYKINKTYILLEELNNSLDKQDKDVFYINYKSAMESINNL